MLAQGPCPQPESVLSSTVQIVRLLLNVFSAENHSLPPGPFTTFDPPSPQSLLLPPRQPGRMGLWHIQPLRLPTAPGLTAGQARRHRELGDLSQVCHAQRGVTLDSWTGGSAEESSIRPASYLQVAEKDTGGCEQKWNLLKRHPAAQTLRQVTRNSIQNSALELVQRATTVTPKALAPAVCTDRQAWRSCGLQRLLEEQLVLETSLATTVPRMEASAPGIY